MPPRIAFAELRAHTAFSFGDGAMTPEALVARAAELGYRSIAITDTADLGGIVRFGAACRESGVQPIVGAELVVDGKPLAVLARNEIGYCHVAALVTLSRSGSLASMSAARPSRGQPRVTWQQLAERAEGLQLLTGPPSSTLASMVRDGRSAEALELLHQWRDQFDGNVAVEVQWHQAGNDELALAGALIELAERARVRWVVAQDARYISESGRLMHDILTALRHRCTVDVLLERGLGHPNGGWELLDPAVLATRWKGRHQGLDAAAAIASECAFDMRWVRPPLPTFPVPDGSTDDAFLRQVTFEGARERWGTLNAKQEQQLHHELGVIGRLGFAGFFLVMWDAVRYAHLRGILCQGRGSAANSAVAYCLVITAIDPVKHGLLFERFLSESRVDGGTEAPDIDVDIEHDRREEVLDYVYGRYDRTRSAITAVTQVYSGSTALQDGMRALGYPAELAFRISKRMRYDDCAHGAERVEQELGAAQGFDVTTPRAQMLLAAMRAAQDLPRLRSTHPGGFVLSSQPLGKRAPIEWTTRGRSIIQFDKDDLDIVGIPKFDFLGLGALAVVRRSFDAIAQRTGMRPLMYGLPQDDAPTYDLISRGDTIGLFQIESRAQIASIMHTKPERLYDITVQVALIRPGPIMARFVHPYTERRRGREAVRYAHPKLEPILARTQGIPIFQEQAMSIAIELAGYRPAEADQLRRTMGSMRKEEKLLAALAQLRERLVAKGIEPAVAEEIESDLHSFANYGFPESHAWSFALIAYVTAWLKTHHPTEFILGLMNAQPMGFYPISTLIHDARRHGVPLKPPCLRDGSSDCTTEPADDPARPALRIGWRFIRGLGTKGLTALQMARAQQPFASIEDVIRRTRMERSNAMALARGGAFAAWEPDPRRASWIALRASGDTLPLAPAREAVIIPRPMSRKARVLLDYFSTGLCLDGHPMEAFRRKFTRLGIESSESLQQVRHGETVLVSGLVIARQRPQTAKGTVFLLLEDEFGHVNVIVPVSVTGDDREAVRYAIIILALGRVERDGGLTQVIATRYRAVKAEGFGHRSRDFR